MRERALRLLDGIIPFWQGLADNTHEGYYGHMDLDLVIDMHADKGCILNSRILWFFSEAAMVLGRKDLLDDARHAYRFLTEYCLDKEYGGVFWSVTYDGKPADTVKYTYNQAFAVYALSAYSQASGDKHALVLAKKLLDLIEAKCRDGEGYLEAFDRSFVPIDNEKLSENGVAAYRTMNTLLHVFEAYGGLCRAAKSPAVEEKMRGMLDMFETKIYNPAKKRQEVFFNELWESLIDLTSYGHDIESSWLLEWGCSQLGDGKLLNHVKPICRALAEGTLEKAFRQGSLRYECVRGIEDERRIWWVQAEAVVGFLNAGMEGAAETVLTFIEKKIADPRPGSEWLSEVYPDGSHTENRAPIVEMWKCPYHNGRMCLEILRRMPE